MKKISKILLVLLSVLVLIPMVNAASSKYETVVTTDGVVENDEFYVILGYKGEEIKDLKFKLGFDEDYLQVSEIYPLNNYTYDEVNETNIDGWTVKDIKVINDEGQPEDNYCKIVFKATNKFKNNKSTQVFIYEQFASGTGEYDYKEKAKTLTLRRTEEDEFTLLVQDSTKYEKIEYWVKANIFLFLIGIAIVIMLIIVILLLPTSRIREQRANKIRNNKRNNSRKIKYNADEHQEDIKSEEVDAFNGKAKKNDYRVVKEEITNYANDSMKTEKQDSKGYGVINPVEFDKKDK